MDDYRKGSKTTLAVIVLSKLDMNIDDLAYKINEYLYWDLNSIQFAKHRAKRTYMYLREINHAMSRANGFYGQEPNNTENPHWAFAIENDSLAFQCIHCPICGEYCHSDIYEYLKENVFCQCV
jgi:hypothetical protein